MYPSEAPQRTHRRSVDVVVVWGQVDVRLEVHLWPTDGKALVRPEL